MNESHQALFAKNVGKLIKYIFDQGYECTLGEAFRTKEQADLDAKQCKGIKNSLHCHRLAVDINLFEKGKYESESTAYLKIGLFWESLDPNNRWGGRFKSRPDGNHFEYHPHEARKAEHGTYVAMPEQKPILRDNHLFETALVVGFVVGIAIIIFKIVSYKPEE